MEAASGGLPDCPFGSDLQKYWDRRYEYFSRFDDGIQIDAEGLYSVVPEQVAATQASYVHGASVLDAFAGVGGTPLGSRERARE